MRVASASTASMGAGRAAEMASAACTSIALTVNSGSSFWPSCVYASTPASDSNSSRKTTGMAMIVTVRDG